MLLPVPGPPPTQTQKATPPPTLREAEALLLEFFDEPGAAAPPHPAVQSQDRPALDWLLAAIQQEVPENPFPRKSAGHREAEALRALWRLPAERRSTALAGLPLRLSGTRLALWRWGKALERGGGMQPILRTQWEDRLLEPTGPLLIREYALRHALCFALAEGDEARFTALKARWSGDSPEIFQHFQGAFGLLGGPSPRFRFWTLPGLVAQEGGLDRFGPAGVWIAFDEGLAPGLPPGVAWIIPTATGGLADQEPGLDEGSLAEGLRLSSRLEAAGRKAFLAPSRTPLEALALAYFPILVELDEAGRITRIRMGDAAPRLGGQAAQ